MSKRSRTISDEQLPEPNAFLRVEVFYQEGGTSYLSGNAEPRGYYVAVRPITKENGMVSFTLFSGVKKLSLIAKRFSEKALGAVAHDMNNPPYSDKLIPEMKAKALAERAAEQARDAARRGETVPA